MRTYADLCVTYADLCGPMRTYADLCGPIWHEKAGPSQKIHLSNNACQDVARALRGAVAPSAATAVTVSASMRPAIAHSQATEEQLRSPAHKGGKCAPESDPLESRT